MMKQPGRKPAWTKARRAHFNATITARNNDDTEPVYYQYHRGRFKRIKPALRRVLVLK